MLLRINNNHPYVTLLRYSVFQIFQINTKTCQMHTSNHS